MTSGTGRRPSWLTFVGSAVVLAALVGCWCFVLPTSLGGSTTFTIVSGPSMEPRFHTGDLVVARPASRYSVGDVVIYRIPDPKYRAFRVVHRIAERWPDGRYVTKGDGQDHADPWMISHDDIAGRQVLAIGKGGYLLGYIHNPLYLAAVFAMLVTYLFWPSKELVDDDAESPSTDDPCGRPPEPYAAPGRVTLDLRTAGSVITLASEPEHRERTEDDIDRFVRDWMAYCSASVNGPQPATV